MPKFVATFAPNPAGISHLLRSPSGAVGRWLLALVNEVRIVAQSNAPVVTGKLRNSIVARVIPAGVGLIGEVAAEAAYAVYVEKGTAAHPIVGNPILRFPSAQTGMIVFTPRVDHPGTKANPFLLDALVFVVGSR